MNLSHFLSVLIVSLAFAAVIKADTVKWAGVIRANNIKAE